MIYILIAYSYFYLDTFLIYLNLFVSILYFRVLYILLIVPFII